MGAGEGQVLAVHPDGAMSDSSSQALPSTSEASSDRSSKIGWRGTSFSNIKGSGLKLFKTVGRSVGKGGKHHSADADAASEASEPPSGAASNSSISLLPEGTPSAAGAAVGTGRRKSSSGFAAESAADAEKAAAGAEAVDTETPQSSGSISIDGIPISAAASSKDRDDAGGEQRANSPLRSFVPSLSALAQSISGRSPSHTAEFPRGKSPLSGLSSGAPFSPLGGPRAADNPKAAELAPAAAAAAAPEAAVTLEFGRTRSPHEPEARTGELRHRPVSSSTSARGGSPGKPPFKGTGGMPPLRSGELRALEKSGELRRASYRSAQTQMHRAPQLHTGEMRPAPPVVTGEMRRAQEGLYTGELEGLSPSLVTDASPRTPGVSRQSSVKSRNTGSPYSGSPKGGAEMFAFCPLATMSAAQGRGIRHSRSFTGSAVSAPSKPLKLPALLEAMAGGEVEAIRAAIEDIRMALKGSNPNKERFVVEGGVPLLVELLTNSKDKETVQHAVTALFNVARTDSGKQALFEAPGGPQSLAAALLSESEEARENAAATIFVLFTPTEKKHLTPSSSRRQDYRGGGSYGAGSFGAGSDTGSSRSLRAASPRGSEGTSPAWADLPANSPLNSQVLLGAPPRGRLAGSNLGNSSGQQEKGGAAGRADGEEAGWLDGGVAGGGASAGGAAAVAAGGEPEGSSGAEAKAERGGAGGAGEAPAGGNQNVAVTLQAVADAVGGLPSSQSEKAAQGAPVAGSVGGSFKDQGDEAVTSSSLSSVDAGQAGSKGLSDAVTSSSLSGGYDSSVERVGGLPPRTNSMKQSLGDTPNSGVLGVPPSRSRGGGEVAAAAGAALLRVHKEALCEAGAIPPLVALMQSASQRGRRDAMLALYVLLHGTGFVDAFVAEGGVERCMQGLAEAGGGAGDLLAASTGPQADSSTEEKVMALLAVAADTEAGRAAILGSSVGLTAVTDGLEAPAQRVKEDAVRVLLRLASNSEEAKRQIAEEGVNLPLKRLVKEGSKRAVAEAQALLQLFGA